jgi:hypothetical protein
MLIVWALGGREWWNAVQSVSGFRNIWTCPTSSLSLFFYSEYEGTRFLTNVDTYPSTIFLQIDSIATYNTHALPPSATVNSEDIYAVMKLWVPVQLLYPDGFLIILKLSEWKLISQESTLKPGFYIPEGTLFNERKIEGTKTYIGFEIKYTKLIPP